MERKIQFTSQWPDNICCMGLDLGTETGIALLDAGTVHIERKSFQTKKGRKTKADEHEGLRYENLRKFLSDLFCHYKPDLVIYEEAGTFRNVMTTRVPFGLRAIMLSAAAAERIPVRGVPVQTLKKYATGSGTAKKEAMIQTAEAKHSLDSGTLNHDQADALHLLGYGISVTYGIEILG